MSMKKYIYVSAELGLGRFEQIPKDLRDWDSLKQNQDISSDVSEDEKRLFLKDQNLRGVVSGNVDTVSFFHK